MNDGDLISRKALLQKECCGRIAGNDVRNAPSVDAEPVVRRKDCKYRNASEFCECRDGMESVSYTHLD